MSKTNPTINFKHKMKYYEEYNDYTLQMKRRKRPWWLLLLLLPLLLLIQCRKDITVTCYEPEGKVPVENANVTLSYQSHFLWNNGKFLASDSIKMTQTTDSDGKTVFKDLPCSVFSYIFYALSTAEIKASDDCHANAEKTCNFHYTRNVELLMAPRLEDLHVRILDLETGDPLPDATLVYKYNEVGTEKTDSVKTDASGVATMPQMRYCSIVDLNGSCYGYADTSRLDMPAQRLIAATDSTALRLRPIKQRFTFFVKNKETKQPIPDAKCMVTLTHPNGKSMQREVHTSIDGKGIAVYPDAFILSKIAIHASKIHYKDGDLEGGPWTVDKFIKQDDDTRTIWLEPDPFLNEFINIDSINGKPIPGVRNEITITDPAGKVDKVTEISNSNGVFPITAKEGSKIEIISIKEPDYVKKTTIIGSYDKGKNIPMQPVMVDLPLRTVKASSGSILPDCELSVTGSISGTLNPDNSGSGEFTVRARLAENLSITASKKGFSTNSHTVNNTPVPDLQNGRDIPLKADPIVFNYRGSEQGQYKECYDLLEAPCEFEFSWTTCSACTMLIVTDGNGNVIGRFGHNDPNGSSRGVTYSAPTGSQIIRTTTETVCVTRTNVNGHDCGYTIRKI